MLNEICYREALKALDWGTETVYTIGHKAPDTDTVTAAIAYADLMQKLGYSVEARIAGKANNETKYAAALFGFPLPPILEDARGKTLILVDHSETCQAVAGAKEARILQIIDHHGLGDVMESKRIFAKIFPVGSTCTIIFTCYQEFGVEVTKKIAQILLAGIVSDTQNLKKKTTTEMDRVVCKILAERLNISSENLEMIYAEMKKAAKNFDGMTDEEIFNSDAKDYVINGHKFRLGSLSFDDKKSINSFLQRMLAVMPKILTDTANEMIFCNVSCHKHSYILYFTEKAERIAESIYGNSESAGIIYVDHRLNRKVDIVPAITQALLS
ncbi:MAG: DHH family phosphoesterase [Hallerella succinigenes]|uniref:DHH family phosphoesterase n=1 Tax=Hallerella succinigenes TaxID=1896222 RepID=UPI0023F3A068|nr:DHH family phosphoesterase [Hallerella succinigenes]MDD6092008.1 DHH family phosphoesterase [Hallerella succinigenes]